jgi:pimeloyl-ACP methyl ester carboxylesterase
MPPDHARGLRAAVSSGARHDSARPPRSPESDEPESIDVRTVDGWSLRTDVHEPFDEPVGVALLAHAMMARRSEFHRPRGRGLAAFLAERGWRVIAFDFRGHGDSTPSVRDGARYGYDDLVTRDLAAQGSGLVTFDGIAALAANVWLRELEPSAKRWVAKRALLSTFAVLSRRLGRLPARALRLGSDDEASVCVEDLARFSRGRWGSADGKVDYLASLEHVCCPVLQVVSDGDRLECVPECGARFVARCSGPTEIVRLSRDDVHCPAPDHMGIVTSEDSRGVWERIDAWMRRVQVAPKQDRLSR